MVVGQLSTLFISDKYEQVWYHHTSLKDVPTSIFEVRDEGGKGFVEGRVSCSILTGGTRQRQKDEEIPHSHSHFFNNRIRGGSGATAAAISMILPPLSVNCVQSRFSQPGMVFVKYQSTYLWYKMYFLMAKNWLLDTLVLKRPWLRVCAISLSWFWFAVVANIGKPQRHRNQESDQDNHLDYVVLLNI